MAAVGRPAVLDALDGVAWVLEAVR